MTRRVEFFFDFGSPASYLAYTQLPRIAAQCDAQIVWRPMLLGGVFKAHAVPQKLFSVLSTAKARHNALDAGCSVLVIYNKWDLIERTL